MVLPGYALEPEEIMVLANKNASESIGLARYYIEKRNIPEKNLLSLWITDKETCSREEFVKKVEAPVKRFLSKKENKGISCIATVYGLPLRVYTPGFTDQEKTKIEKMDQHKLSLENNRKTETDKIKQKALDREISTVNKNIKKYKMRLDKTASFDSELMLVKKENYDIRMWIPNPYFVGFSGRDTGVDKNDIIMVSRLDGADSDTVKRIIDDSIYAEKNGLKGKAYFDARWEYPEQKDVSGYFLYDRSIHNAYRFIKSQNRIDAVLDQEEKLFKPDECPDTAMYCGWYSLGKYIDSFTWTRGSVGFHIASRECRTLKNEKSSVWCKKIIDNGAAATAGPVEEPYVQAFPFPEIFFKSLAKGYMTLAESYLLSIPYLSWKMVLVGDPLYRVNLKNIKK
jgi:uncharacterized protein (TIGR03790 family)